MDILSVIIVGIVAGWIAGVVMKGGGFGLVGDLVVGLIGALVGRLLFGLFGLAAYGLLGSIVVAAVGAIVFLWIARRIKHV